jgi:hypothetical protein
VKPLENRLPLLLAALVLAGSCPYAQASNLEQPLKFF